MSDQTEKQPESETACDPALTRSQFITKLVERAAQAGVLALIPAIADSFIAPPALAKTSGGNLTFMLKNNLPPIA
jgi:hypothetical protein